MVGNEGTTPLRSGRLRLSNKFGSEKVNLGLPVQAQYWSGLSWVLSSDDACTGTVLTAVGGRDAVALSGYVSSATPALASSNLGTSHVSGFTTDGNGKWNLILTKPDLVSGKTPTGSVDVCVDLGADPTPGVTCTATTSAAIPWLQGKWPPGTAYNNDPSARATFGIYAPETRKSIHVRESY
jgi:MSHA biogenesis protein MshQ